MNIDQFNSYVLIPTFEKLPLLDSPVARDLVLATILHESNNLEYIKQVGGGPALGVCQMEPATHKSLYADFLDYRPSLAKEIKDAANCSNYYPPDANELIHNLRYAVAMCRVKYYRVSEALPNNTPFELAGYWKRHYNTLLGKGVANEFAYRWKNYIDSR